MSIASQSSVKNTRSCQQNMTRHVVKEPENKSQKHCRLFFSLLSYPITHPADDGVQILDFTFQQHHSGTLSAVLVGMVQHHIEEVTDLGCDTCVL